jgi:hypothetical protein
MTLELGFIPAETAGEQFIQNTNAWEAPRLPGLDQKNMRRWASGATWVPPDSKILVRHRSLDGTRRLVTNDRRPPEGFSLEYDLGLVHSFAQPGTRRLIASKSGYFCSQFEGGLDDGYDALGYVEEAPLPLLQALELRRDRDTGNFVLVAGADDPLHHATVFVASLGFIEGYPINPRHPPRNEIDWGTAVLLRRTDTGQWRHSYIVESDRTAADIALGGVWTLPAQNLATLYLDGDGRMSSDILKVTPIRGHRLKAKIRWAAAPLGWPEGMPRSWAARAVAGRARKLLARDSDMFNSSLMVPEETILGYVRKHPRPGWSPIFSATHPALMDQYVTRSELEATDMGYSIDGVLGYVIDRFVDRSHNALPDEIKWASRFGQRRRYVEGPNPYKQT